MLSMCIGTNVRMLKVCRDAVHECLGSSPWPMGDCRATQQTQRADDPGSSAPKTSAALHYCFVWNEAVPSSMWQRQTALRHQSTLRHQYSRVIRESSSADAT